VNRAAALLAVAMLGLGLAGCRASPPADAQTPIVIEPPQPTTGPYVVVAVDNHFHDIHPADHKTIGEDRPFIVKNEGGNLHNFTVVGTAISFDIRPGGKHVWQRIGDVLSPGTYQVYCKYHGDRGMTGAFTVIP
jgi:hypothetical protein